MTKEIIDINLLIEDDKNFNKGTEEGDKLIQKSIKNLGLGRSVVLDKNNRVIAGNKTLRGAKSAGTSDVLVIETTGDRLVAVKRMDLDIDSKKGRELALADNATAKANLLWDEDVIKELAEEHNIDTEEWGVFLADDIDIDSFFDEEKEKAPKGKAVTCPKCGELIEL